MHLNWLQIILIILATIGVLIGGLTLWLKWHWEWKPDRNNGQVPRPTEYNLV